jgi:phenylacetate-CoA ligase
VTSLADLCRLPTLKKADLVADQAAHPPYGTNLTQPVDGYTRLHQTSGTTTGQPLRWLDTPRNWAGLMECWRQIYRLMPLQPDERCCFPFSFGPFLGFWAGFEAAMQQGRFVIAAGGLSSEARLQLIADNRITLVGCTPTYALRLAEVASQRGLDLTQLGVRTILVAGEPGGNIPALRDRIESAWNADVVDHWGMTEIGPLGVTADGAKPFLTILETECLAEILHPDRDEPVAPGNVGELAITTLCRPDSPVFRFRTGDLVRAATTPDPQGRSLLRLDGGILGRTDDMLLIRGNNVFPSSIEGVIREQPEIVEYRIVCTKHREMQHLRIEIEPEPALPSDAVADLMGRLSRALKDRLNFQASVQAVPCGSLPRFEMKARRLVRE